MIVSASWGDGGVPAYLKSGATAVDSARDYVFTKSHYSAFESNQLLMRLRFRFITELYICGSLTNISVYATIGYFRLAKNPHDDKAFVCYTKFDTGIYV